MPSYRESAVRQPPSLPVATLTWAALLGRWIDFARSAVALPDDDEGNRLRESVPDIIMLQAVWFALGQLEELPDVERALGIDRAEVLIEKHAGAIRRRWRSDGVPDRINEIIDDAQDRLSQAKRTMAG